VPCERPTSDGGIKNAKLTASKPNNAKRKCTSIKSWQGAAGRIVPGASNGVPNVNKMKKLVANSDFGCGLCGTIIN
jgi:hypothetical protein